MNIISPLTLLIVPLIGSLIIVSYPYFTDKETTGILAKETGPFRKRLLTGPAPSQVTRAFALGRERSEELIQMPMIDKKNSNLKKIAIITSLVNFIISIILWIQFDSSYIGYQFVTEIFVSQGLAQPEFIQLNLGVDGISLFFVLLTTFITPIALLSSHNDIEKNLKFYLVSILLLETLQIAVFVVLDLLLFYIFFESVLIPLFFIVGV